MSKEAYTVCTGTVQCYVHKETGEDGSMFMHHFGWAEYDRNKPIFKDRYRKEVQPILDGLNNGTMTEAEAIVALDAIRF
jgi:hypothetical protein